MTNTKVETLTGAAVIAVATLFAGFAYKVVGFGSVPQGYHVTAEFDSIDGVHVGTDIRLAGIKVGTVTSQKLNPENFQAVVTMVLDPIVKLSDDTSAKVTADGLLGGKFITLEPGGSDIQLAEGSMITSTQGAVDIWSLISQVMFAKKDSGPSAASAPTFAPIGGGPLTDSPTNSDSAKTPTDAPLKP